MTEEDKKDFISVDYLIDLISSIKSSLSNMENHNEQIYNILSSAAQNQATMVELFKHQNQDHKFCTSKLDYLQKQLSDFYSKNELATHDIISSHDKLLSNLNIIFDFKKENMEELGETLKKISDDLLYLKNKELTKEAKSQSRERKSQDGKDKKIFSKIIDFIKNINESVGMLYKIVVLVFGIVLIIMMFMGYITWDDIKNIVSLKFFG